MTKTDSTSQFPVSDEFTPLSQRGRLNRRQFLGASVLGVGALTGASALLAACGGSSSSSNVTITLEAPNQWTDSGTDFGPGWTAALDQYKKLRPNVTVKINVLPLSSFAETTSTKLASGTAPEIVFNQATYKPFMVTKLDDYLNQQNPYATDRPKWIDWFNKNAYSVSSSANADGHLYWIPLNLVDVGLFINTDLFNKAGVAYPIKTFEDWRAAVQKFKAIGVTPMAMDNSAIGIAWPVGSIFNMLMTKYYDQFNLFDASGKPGTNPTLTGKDLVRAIHTGKLAGNLPEVGEALTLAKELYTDAATPNWSGIKGLSGAGVNLDDFINGKAAMAWGVNFGASAVAKASFKVGSMPFPTITTATTPLSVNQPAQFGVTTGGTSYMIPSTTKGDKLKWAVDFLRYMTAPKYAQPWITATTGVPSVDDVTAPASIAGFSAGDWGTSPKSNAYALQGLTPQQGTDWTQIIQGYLLGSTSLSETQSKITDSWKSAADQSIKDNNWGSEDWAK